MTPAARAAAAIAVLDRILAGEPAEQALTNWGRASRYAGSGDRHAVRDLVYDALRCKRSHAALGGGMTGRGLVLGGLIDRGEDPAALFTGQGHAPAALTDNDRGQAASGAAALDVQDWMYPMFAKALRGEVDNSLEALRRRAPVFLRVNPRKAGRDQALAALAAEGVVAQAVTSLSFGLQVYEGARKIQSTSAYLDGWVELQDASSQAVVEALPLVDGQRVLDYCAGGGGKTLAMAARARLQLYAHDADQGRMRDLPTRAGRAGEKIILTENAEKTEPYDLILTDVPCSGSGSWRRDPMGKWALTPERLQALRGIQDGILRRVCGWVRPGGVLAYATCSLFCEENEEVIAGFLDNDPAWRCTAQHRFSPLGGGDGFFLALLSRD